MPDFDYSAKNWFEKRLAAHKPLLEYSPCCDFAAYQLLVRQKLTELLGDMPDYKKSVFHVISDTKKSAYREIALHVETSDDTFACKLIIPLCATKKAPAPVIVFLQGHHAGMDISLGIAQTDTDRQLVADGMDFALQAIERGCAAFLIEMRAMGERRFDSAIDQNTISCYRPTMAALLYGQTMAGLRVSDVQSGISALFALSEESVTTKKLALLGHSGGGTAAFYTACLDDRVKTLVMSCSLCTFAGSILHTQHCCCNYIPGIFNYFDMSDMAACLFPRLIICVAGIDDKIFLIEETEKTVNRINAMYGENGAKNSCTLIKGQGGHLFYKEAVWRELLKILY